MTNILSWKLALAAAALSGVAMSASANQGRLAVMPGLTVKGEITAVRIIARAGRRDLKLQQKKRARDKERARNKKKGRYSSDAGYPVRGQLPDTSQSRRASSWAH
jgi:hypothetical protein